MHALAMSPSEETISIIVAVGHGSHRRHQCTHGLLPHHMHRHRSTQMPLHAPQCHRKRTFHIERPTLYYPSYDGHNFLNLSTFHDDLYLESLELSLWVRWYVDVLEQSFTISRILGYYFNDSYESQEKKKTLVLKTLVSNASNADLFYKLGVDDFSRTIMGLYFLKENIFGK